MIAGFLASFILFLLFTPGVIIPKKKYSIIHIILLAIIFSIVFTLLTDKIFKINEGATPGGINMNEKRSLTKYYNEFINAGDKMRESFDKDYNAKLKIAANKILNNLPADDTAIIVERVTKGANDDTTTTRYYLINELPDSQKRFFEAYKEVDKKLKKLIKFIKKKVYNKSFDETLKNFGDALERVKLSNIKTIDINLQTVSQYLLFPGKYEPTDNFYKGKDKNIKEIAYDCFYISRQNCFYKLFHDYFMHVYTPLYDAIKNCVEKNGSDDSFKRLETAIKFQDDSQHITNSNTELNKYFAVNGSKMFKCNLQRCNDPKPAMPTPPPTPGGWRRRSRP